MYRRALGHLSKETPLERIFRKVIGRKMTELERISFHLKPVLKAVTGKPA